MMRRSPLLRFINRQPLPSSEKGWLLLAVAACAWQSMRANAEGERILLSATIALSNRLDKEDS